MAPAARLAHLDPMMELVLMIGLQASGKSSFVRQNFHDSHVVVSKDHFRNNRRPEARQRELIRDALEHGSNVVVDNTNPRPEDRLPLIGIGRECGARIVGYYFEPSIRESVARNQTRIGKARVPNVAIFATAKKLTPPSHAEGYDRLYRVASHAGERFEVTPWPRDSGKS